MDGRTPYVAGKRGIAAGGGRTGKSVGKAGGQIRWQWMEEVLHQRTNDGDVIQGRIQNM